MNTTVRTGLLNVIPQSDFNAGRHIWAPHPHNPGWDLWFTLAIMDVLSLDSSALSVPSEDVKNLKVWRWTRSPGSTVGSTECCLVINHLLYSLRQITSILVWSLINFMTTTWMSGLDIQTRTSDARAWISFKSAYRFLFWASDYTAGADSVVCTQSTRML